jgi:hypothetical protein
MTKKASKEVRSFLSKIGRIGGTTGKGTPKSLDKIRAARAARKAKRQQYPRWEFVTGGCGYGHRAFLLGSLRTWTVCYGPAV